MNLTKLMDNIATGMLLALVTLVALGTILAAVRAAMWVKNKPERERATSEYIQSHGCKRVGFAGKYPEPIYQCGGEQYLYDEITVIAGRK